MMTLRISMALSVISFSTTGTGMSSPIKVWYLALRMSVSKYFLRSVM